MKKLIEGLREFRGHAFHERREAFERCAAGQRPQALIITCSDSRVLPETLLQVDPGDLFVSRNAGNLVPPAEVPSGEAATIEYALSALGIRDVIVCGHYRCGAVRALLHPEEAKGLDRTRQWLDLATESDPAIYIEDSHLDADAQWDAAVERNVLVQVENLSSHPVVAAGLADGSVRIHAWTLRFETSEVFQYDPEVRRFESLTDPTAKHHESHGSVEGRDAEVAIARPERRFPLFSTDFLSRDLAASFTVFLVALPLCIAIAKASGAPPEAGLLTGIIGGMIVGLLGGSSFQVSGPSAGLVVILLDAFQRHGWEALGAITLLAGALQIGAGVLGIGRWFRAVSPAVVIGMLAGIGAVIFAQQFHVVLDDAPSNTFLGNAIELPRAAIDVVRGHLGHTGHLAAAAIGILTLAVLLSWSRLVPKRVTKIPSVLAAVTLAAIAALLFDLPVQRVEFRNLGSAIQWFDVLEFSALLSRTDIWATAFIVAAVASAESLLCVAAIDRMHDGSRSNFDRELVAQGFGNALCGAVGALPLSGAIVRSSTNIQAGARTRAATVFHGVWLLAIAVLFPQVFAFVPAAALAAVLALSGLKLIDLKAIRSLWAQGRSEAVVCLVTAATVALSDLLTGVALGIALSVAKLIATSTRLTIRDEVCVEGERSRLKLEGAATFLRLPTLAAALERIPRGRRVEFDLEKLGYVDHACLTLLTDWRSQQERSGGKVDLNEDRLHDLYTRSHLPRAGTSTSASASLSSEVGDARRAA